MGVDKKCGAQSFSMDLPCYSAVQGDEKEKREQDVLCIVSSNFKLPIVFTLVGQQCDMFLIPQPNVRVASHFFVVGGGLGFHSVIFPPLLPGI